MASNRGPPGQIPTYADLEELRMSLIAIPNSMDKGTDAALNARLRALAPANMHAKLKQQEREIARLELERDNALNKGKAVEEARIQLALETAARVKAGYKNNTLAAKLASIEMERDMLVKYSKTEPLQANTGEATRLVPFSERSVTHGSSPTQMYQPEAIKDATPAPGSKKRRLSPGSGQTSPGQASIMGIIVCTLCYIHDLQCDTQEPCKNCDERGVGVRCKRKLCDKAGACVRTDCAFAHPGDGYVNAFKMHRIRRADYPCKEPKRKKIRNKKG